MAPSHRNYVVFETMKSIIVNVALGTIAILIASHGKQLVPLMEEGGVVINLIPQTFMTAFMSALVATVMTRRQRQQGALPSSKQEVLHPPPHALLRAIIFGISTLVIALPILYFLLPMLTPPIWQKQFLIAFTIIYAIILSIIITPIVLLRTLSEHIETYITTSKSVR